jgi:hemolysin D
MRTLRERLSMRTTLAAEGWESRSNVLDALEELQREAEAQAASRGEILQADAERGTLLRDIVQTTAQFLDQDAQSLKDAQDRLDQAIQQTVKADAQLQHTQLRAPIAGTVQELAITTPGQVVSAGEQVMTLVPDTPKLEIEALVDNKDIGFVHPGQPVVIKVQAFTFTRYGTIGGHVVRVARDAVAAREAAGDQDTGIKPVPAQSADASAVPETQNLVYPVTVRLDRDTMTIDGRPLRLTPGMQATVDIKTGSRRALNYLLSPILQAASGAAHER